MNERQGKSLFHSFKYAVKQVVKHLPLTLTSNQKYDRQTGKIIKKICQPHFNCVDVGTHRGDILDIFLKHAPRGQHFGFEPVPHLYEYLVKKYAGYKNTKIFELALSSSSATSEFNYVSSNPAYSGIKKRRYDRKHETDSTIEVQTAMLDEVIPHSLPVHFIKIDVEGGEMDVLKGAVRILSTYHPVIFFECGIGGSDMYGTTPEIIYDFFSDLGYHISLLKSFLDNEPVLMREEFSEQFYQRKNYFFMALKKKY